MNKQRLGLQLLVSIMLGISMVHANEMSTDVNWIMAGDSPSIDRSASYLARGKLEQGIRYAVKALKRNQSATDQLIATHNLCLALTLNGQENEAQGYCEKVAQMDIPALAMKKVNQGLYKLTKRKPVDSSVMFGAIIADNLNMLNTDVQLSYVD